MYQTLQSIFFIVLLSSFLTAAEEPVLPKFEAPFVVKIGDVPLQTEKPGYASPTMVDLNGDGLEDLVVGQFKSGMMVYCENTGKAGAPEFKTRAWILTGEEKAVVPGVW